MEHKALVIEDDEASQTHLKSFLEGRGYQVLTAAGEEEGLRVYREASPIAVFCGVNQEELDGLEFLRKLLAVDENAHVILVAAHADKEHVLQALRHGATNFFHKPLDFQDIGEFLGALESRAIAEHGNHFDVSFVVSESKVLEIPNDLNIVSAVVTQITQAVQFFFDEQAIHGLQGALIEMIVNAIEHGNLGISYEEKTKALESDRLAELIQQKSQHPEVAKKKVRIEYKLDQEKVTYVICDEGDGFDFQELPDPGDPDNLWLGHGRGILMTRALMDEVNYNETGTEVTLVKYLPILDEIEFSEE